MTPQECQQKFNALLRDELLQWVPAQAKNWLRVVNEAVGKLVVKSAPNVTLLKGSPFLRAGLDQFSFFVRVLF